MADQPEEPARAGPGGDPPAVLRVLGMIRASNLGPWGIQEIINYVEALQRERDRDRLYERALGTQSAHGQAFVRLSEAIEAVSEKITSAEYKELYDAALAAREAPALAAMRAVQLPPSVAELDALGFPRETGARYGRPRSAVHPNALGRPDLAVHLGMVRPLNHWSVQGGEYGFVENGRWRPVSYWDVANAASRQ